MTNLQEYLSATDPGDPASAFRIKSVVRSGSDLVIGFTTVTGKTYTVQKAPSLDSEAQWSTVQDNLQGTGGIKTITDSGAAAQPRAFYRVILTSPAP